MAETDFEVERAGEGNRFQRASAFRSHRQEHGIGVCDRAQLAYVVRRRVEHQRRIMRAVKAWFGRKKRSFNMPTGNRMAQSGLPGSQLAELLEPLDQLRPCVSDQ